MCTLSIDAAILGPQPRRHDAKQQLLNLSDLVEWAVPAGDDRDSTAVLLRARNACVLCAGPMHRLPTTRDRTAAKTTPPLWHFVSHLTHSRRSQRIAY